jgi:Fe2+ transport system protein B
MSNHEKVSPPEHHADPLELESIRGEHQERIKEQLDKAELEHKQKSKENLQELQHAAQEEAQKTEQLAATRDRSPAERRRTGVISRRERDQSFSKQMETIAPHLTDRERSFSRIIHNKKIEKTSDTLASTIARPNALLAGSVAAFILVTGVFLIAKHYGYPLSGFETIAAFALGWIIGMIYDYARLLIRGNRQQ